MFSTCSPRLCLWIVLFVASGIASPLLITQARYLYHPPAGTLWPLYPLYLGNLLAGAFSPRVTMPHWKSGTQLFALDIIGQTLTNLGLLAVGPPLYAILYKSITVFTGLLSLCFLPQSSHPSKRQWAAMVLITAGLCVQGVGGWNLLRRSEILGGALVLCGCVFFAGGAVASEVLLGGGRQLLGPLQAAQVVGVEGSILLAVWAVGTARGPVSPGGFWLLFAILVLTNAAHQASWFTLVGQLGACATAVLKALQSVFLFLGASAAFCGRDPSECMTREKVFSFVIVSLGVLLYSYPNQQNGSSAATPPETEPLVNSRSKQ